MLEGSVSQGVAWKSCVGLGLSRLAARVGQSQGRRELSDVDPPVLVAGWQLLQHWWLSLLEQGLDPGYL